MVKNHVLQPIIDAAARLGEGVLSSRAAQKAFERRSVHKYAFTVAPLHGAEASPTYHSCDPGRGGGRGRRMVVFPELGQVVSVCGNSTLVAHRESLSLQYLRRSFLRIGHHAAWGKVRSGRRIHVWVRKRAGTFLFCVGCVGTPLPTGCFFCVPVLFFAGAALALYSSARQNVGTTTTRAFSAPHIDPLAFRSALPTSEKSCSTTHSSRHRWPLPPEATAAPST